VTARHSLIIQGSETLNVVYYELDNHLVLFSHPQLPSLGMDSADWALKCRHVQLTRGKRIHTCSFVVVFFNSGLRGYWHCGHSWPIVPASVDSEDDYGEADGM
jgi:hypothetical protein